MFMFCCIHKMHSVSLILQTSSKSSKVGILKRLNLFAILKGFDSLKSGIPLFRNSRVGEKGRKYVISI